MGKQRQSGVGGYAFHLLLHLWGFNTCIAICAKFPLLPTVHHQDIEHLASVICQVSYLPQLGAEGEAKIQECLPEMLSKQRRLASLTNFTQYKC